MLVPPLVEPEAGTEGRLSHGDWPVCPQLCHLWLLEREERQFSIILSLTDGRDIIGNGWLKQLLFGRARGFGRTEYQAMLQTRVQNPACTLDLTLPSMSLFLLCFQGTHYLATHPQPQDLALCLWWTISLHIYTERRNITRTFENCGDWFTFYKVFILYGPIEIKEGTSCFGHSETSPFSEWRLLNQQENKVDPHVQLIPLSVLPISLPTPSQFSSPSVQHLPSYRI